MKKLLIIPLLLLTWSANAVTFSYEVDATWALPSEDPFPNPVVSPDKKTLEWGTGPPPSSALLVDHNGFITAGGDPVAIVELIHSNNPVEEFWEPGDSSMTGEEATASIVAAIDLYFGGSSVASATAVAEDLTFYETRNDNDPPDGPGEIGEDHTFLSNVDDLWTADPGITSGYFTHDGQLYQVNVAGFFESPDAVVDQDNTPIEEDFWSTEGGDSSGWIGMSITPVPEPSTVLLIILGACVALWRRK